MYRRQINEYITTPFSYLAARWWRKREIRGKKGRLGRKTSWRQRPKTPSPREAEATAHLPELKSKKTDNGQKTKRSASFWSVWNEVLESQRVQLF